VNKKNQISVLIIQVVCWLFQLQLFQD